MRHRSVLAGTAAAGALVLAGWSGQAAAAQDSPAPEARIDLRQAAQPPQERRTRSMEEGRRARAQGSGRFLDGGSGDRRFTIRELRRIRRHEVMLNDIVTDGLPAGEWNELLDQSERLSDYYLARADRQQTIVDGSAWLTAGGMLGAGLSTTRATQLNWGYGALLGIITVNFTGSQPMRDLYFAGHLGVEFVENRYVVMHNRGRLLESMLAADEDRPDQPLTISACEAGARDDDPGVLEQVGAVEQWPAGSDKTLILPVVRRMAATCASILAGEEELRQIQDFVGSLDDAWPAAFASDLIAVDAALMEGDARLRLTPANALTSAAVGPLRVLDSLISGENTQQAVDRVRINALLDDMTIQLQPVRLPAPPNAITETVTLSPTFDAEIAAARPAAGASAAQAGKDKLLTWVRRRLPRIEAARIDFNNEVMVARELHDAATRSVLNFDYAVATGSANVGLVAPGAVAQPSAPAAPAATSAARVDTKEAAPQVLPVQPAA